MFRSPLLKFTKSLLKTVADDYKLSADELISRYCCEQKIPCPHKTGKGTPCKNSCLSGENHCHLHSVIKPPKEEKPKKIKKKKVVPTAPSHSHLPGQSDPECLLCKSHGDAFISCNLQFEVA